MKTNSNENLPGYVQEIWTIIEEVKEEMGKE